MSTGFSGENSNRELVRMQQELDDLLLQYEKLVGDKLHLFTEMLSTLREITRNNESVICAEEEIARLKTNMDFVKRDIVQKRRMLEDQRNMINEMRSQMRDIDDEIAEKDSRIAELDDAVKSKDLELQDLDDLIMHKDRIIGQMQQELVSVEEQRKKECEDKRQRDIQDALSKAN